MFTFLHTKLFPTDDRLPVHILEQAYSRLFYQEVFGVDHPFYNSIRLNIG